MPTYYCDLDAASFVDRTGADSTTNVLTGAGGLQQLQWGQGAIAGTWVAAGDTVYIKGTYDVNRLVRIDCNGKDCTGWTIGADVQDLDNAGASWTGKLVATNALVGGTYRPIGTSPGSDDIIIVELAAGKTAANVVVAQGINNTTDADTQDPLTSVAVTNPISVRSGGHAAYIRFIGVNSSWTEDGTCFTLDGGAAGTKAAYCYNHPRHYYLFKHMILRRATTANLYAAGTDSDENRFYRCIFELSGGDGTYVGNLRYTIYEKCQWLNNTDKGQEYGHYSCRFLFCFFSGNARHINSLSDNNVLYGCVFNTSTSGGVAAGGPRISVLNNVFNDGAGGSGLGTASYYHCIVGNRFTNNGTYGLSGAAAASEGTWEDYNVYYNNGTAAYERVMNGGNSLSAVSTAEQGYVDEPNADLNLTAAAIIRSTAIVVNWTP